MFCSETISFYFRVFLLCFINFGNFEGSLIDHFPLSLASPLAICFVTFATGVVATLKVWFPPIPALISCSLEREQIQMAVS